MTNTSATGGYLLPSDSLQWVGTGPIVFYGSGPITWATSGGSPPLEDDALEDWLQAFVVGIVGLDGSLVRPRWQPEPPNLPAFGVSWASLGVVNNPADTYAYETFDSTGAFWMVKRHETLEVALSFYGPEANANAERLREGLAVPQNREPLFGQGMVLQGTSEHRTAPQLIKERWLSRVDLTVTLRREVIRVYPVLNILTVSGTLTTGNVSESIGTH